MKSFNIGKISGIDIELHSTFVLFIGFFVLLLALFDPANLIGSIILIIFLFTSVFFHELSHSMVSIQKGIKVKKIILLPIGGMALTEKMPDKPKDEFLIAIAGPLFNFAVVFFLIVLIALTEISFPTSEIISEQGINSVLMNYPVFALLYVNLMLGAFNLFVPALPLDGGRVWRSLLAIKFGKSKATKFISKLSEIIAVILFIAGLFGAGILLSVIAVFIYFASKQENEMQQMKYALKGISIKGIINKKIPATKTDLYINDLFELMQKENKQAFLFKGKRISYIDLNLMKKFQRKKWNKIKISNIAVEAVSVPSAVKAEKAMEWFMTTNYQFILVKEKQKIKGIIERKEMEKLFELAKAEKKI